MCVRIHQANVPNTTTRQMWLVGCMAYTRREETIAPRASHFAGTTDAAELASSQRPRE